MCFICGILLLAMLIIVPFVYAQNSVKIAKLKAFEQYNNDNYAIAVTKTESILSEEKFVDKQIAGSLEKIEVGQSISERITEWRDGINEYNLKVSHNQRLRTLWIYPGWLVMPAEVQELNYLMIK